MGQFGNQPDFGTEAAAVTASDTISYATNVQRSCLYIGTGGNVKVILSGVTGAGDQGFQPPQKQYCLKTFLTDHFYQLW